MFIIRHHDEILIKHNSKKLLVNMTVNTEKLHNFINLTHKIKFQSSQINNLERAECTVKHIMRLIDRSQPLFIIEKSEVLKQFQCDVKHLY